MFENENLIDTLKDRQRNHKCLICGKELDFEEDLFFAIYHSIGEVLVCRKHIKFTSIKDY